MGKSSSAPSYSSTIADSNLWGSSTTGKGGLSYAPSGWVNDTMTTVERNYNKTLKNLLSGDYANDANFNAYKNQLNQTTAQNYDTGVLAPLAKRGLMRSSGLQAATKSFNDAMANNTTNLYDSYYNRQADNLGIMSNSSDKLFDYMMNLGGLSQKGTDSLNNWNANIYNTQQRNNGNNFLSSIVGKAIKYL